MLNLNSSWDFWYHSTNDTDWSISSYKKIATISTIEQFWSVFNLFTATHIQNGMFFVMREGILPLWEDDQNKTGGCWSFKIIKKDVFNAWNELAINLLGENITKEATFNTEINGISISPKKSFCIIKIWNKDSSNNNSKILSKRIPYLYICDCIYKPHIKT